MVLAFTVAEGAANDWLSLALIDGYDVEHWVGVDRLRRLRLRDDRGPTHRAGRAGPVRPGAGPVGLGGPGRGGIAPGVLGGSLVLVGLGILVWGLGASLGFPVGMSAAADDPARAAARVSVVSTIGYGAFLAGPPLLGALADRVGTLDSLSVVPLLMIPAALTVFAARRPRPAASRSPSVSDGPALSRCRSSGHGAGSATGDRVCCAGCGHRGGRASPRDHRCPRPRRSPLGRRPPALGRPPARRLTPDATSRIPVAPSGSVAARSTAACSGPAPPSRRW